MKSKQKLIPLQESHTHSLSASLPLSGLSPILPINNYNQMSMISFHQPGNCSGSPILWDGQCVHKMGQLCNRSVHANSGSQPCPAAVSVSPLALCGVKEGSNFIVLFLDFNLDFSCYDTLCAWMDRDVCTQFLGTVLSWPWAPAGPRFLLSL
jgi:hypothetical protein